MEKQRSLEELLNFYRSAEQTHQEHSAHADSDCDDYKDLTTQIRAKDRERTQLDRQDAELLRRFNSLRQEYDDLDESDEDPKEIERKKREIENEAKAIHEERKSIANRRNSLIQERQKLLERRGRVGERLMQSRNVCKLNQKGCKGLKVQFGVLARRIEEEGISVIQHAVNSSKYRLDDSGIAPCEQRKNEAEQYAQDCEALVQEFGQIVAKIENVLGMNEEREHER